MKKIVMFLCAIITFSVSCKDSFYLANTTMKNDNLPSGCEGLIDVINKKWKKSKQFGYYTIEPSFIMNELVIPYKLKSNCFLQLDTLQIIKLFGEPNNRTIYEYQYFLEKDCFDIHKSCRALVFEFNKNGKIINADEGGRRVIN
jgi:hypothetical protein